MVVGYWSTIRYCLHLEMIKLRFADFFLRKLLLEKYFPVFFAVWIFPSLASFFSPARKPKEENKPTEKKPNKRWTSLLKRTRSMLKVVALW